MRFQHSGRSTGGKYRKRRAVSEIVAVLIMVAVVVSLGVLVFAFASAGLGALTGNFQGLMSNQGNAVAEHFVVEQVTYTFSGTTGADVYVRNVGTIASTLVSVYVVDQTTGTFVNQFALTPAPGIALNVGTYVDLTHTTVTFTPSHGHTYSFTVTSFLGNSVIYNAKAN
jgi:flagellin-like protein